MTTVVTVASMALSVLAGESSEALSAREKSAVVVAERFVAAQGYTTAAASARQADLQLEMFDFDGPESALKLRRDTLVPRAYGVSCISEGCVVVFEYSERMKREHPQSSGREVGRAVSVSSDSSRVRLEHQDYFLRAVAKRVRARE